MTTVTGQDWASYQPSAPSTRGLAFVFVKATEGTGYISPRHAAQVAHARAGGLVVGHYHFQRPGSPTAQAAYFLQHAAPCPGDLLACDWEDQGVPDQNKDAFIKAVQKAKPGLRVLLYCNRDFWLNRDHTSFAGDGLWIADPEAAPGHPRVEHAWTFHQYGISGTDLNVGNFPTAAALRAWAAKGTTVPVPPKAPTTTPKETKVTPQIVDIPQTGDIGTTDPKTSSGRKEYGAGYYLAHLLDESRKQTALLTDIKSALAAKEN